MCPHVLILSTSTDALQKLRLGKDLLSNSKTAYRFQQCFEAPSILFTTFESRQIALQYHKVHYPIPRPSWALWDDNGYAAAMNHTIDVSLKAELNLDGQQPTRLGKVHFVPFYSNPSSDICTFIPNAHMPFGHALDLVIDFAANMKLSRYVIDVRHMVSASGKDGTAASDVQREAIMSMICYIMLLRKQDPHMALKHIILRCTKTRQASMAALVRHWRQRFVRYEEHKSATAGDDGDVPPVVQTRSSRYPAITCLAWKDAWL